MKKREGEGEERKRDKRWRGGREQGMQGEKRCREGGRQGGTESERGEGTRVERNKREVRKREGSVAASRDCRCERARSHGFLVAASKQSPVHLSG